MELSQLLEEIDPNLKKDDPSYKNLVKTVKFLETKEKVLFLTTPKASIVVVNGLVVINCNNREV